MQNNDDMQYATSLALLPLLLSERSRSGDTSLTADLAHEALRESLSGNDSRLLEISRHGSREGLIHRDSDYFTKHSSEYWLSFGVSRSIKFLYALTSCDTKESQSWIERCSYDGPSSIASRGFASPQGWHVLTTVAKALDEDPVLLGIENSLIDAASTLHHGIKYAALFGARDPFPESAYHIFEPEENLMTFSEDDSHVANCARRLLKFGGIPDRATVSWLGGLSTSVLDVLLPGLERASIVSNLEIDHEVYLGSLVQAVKDL